MTITMSMVLDALAPFSPTETGLEGSESRFDSVKLMSSSMESYQPSTLYVATQEELESYLRERQPGAVPPGCIVAVADSAWSASVGCGLPLVFVSDAYSLSQVFNCIQEMFLRFFQWAMELERSVYTCSSLQEMTDIGEPMFSGLLLLWDAAFNIMAHSRHQAIQNKFFLKVIQQGYFPGDAVDNLLKRNLLGSPEHHPSLRVLSDDFVSECPFYIRHFFHNGHRNCSAALVATGELPTQGELDMLQYFFERMELYVNLHLAQGEGCDSLDEMFLQELMDGTITDFKEIADRANVFSIPFQQDYLVYAIDFEHFSKSHAEFLISLLRQKLPRERIFIKEDQVCLLKSANAYCCDREETRSNFSSLLRTYNANCGLSQEFHTLAGCRAAYMQACAALRLGKRLSGSNCGNGGIFLYKDYTIYHMLEICDQQIDLLSLLPGRMISFYKASRANGRNDIELLSTYMDSGMSMAATAQALFLHRNSVAYRIKRIEEQLHMEFSDMDSVLSIQILLKIIQYLNSK